MAYGETQADVMLQDLAGEGVTEKKMFGGLAFMFDGNMVCGIHKGGAMFRVGRENHARALALPGVGEMLFTGKSMTGMVDARPDAMVNDTIRAELMTMSLAAARAMPPKLAKPAKKR